MQYVPYQSHVATSESIVYYAGNMCYSVMTSYLKVFNTLPLQYEVDTKLVTYPVSVI